MEIINDLEKIDSPLKNPVLTIGNFDGVHRGHLVLFNKVMKRASAIGGQSVVMTFDPHPIKVLKPGNGPPIITPTAQKLKLISDSGIDMILCLPFTQEFASIQAENFIKEILVKKIGIKEIVVGYDYSFGSDRKGGIDLLRNIGREMGFRVHMVKPIVLDDVLVSSTSIRSFIQEGKLSQARHLLGRDYQICGTVVQGAGRGGKLLGFPTANLNPIDELIPKKGVYAITLELEGEIHYGVCNIGNNPTFGENARSIEPHIFDFSDNIVGKTIKVNFIEYLREEISFSGFEELKNQISSDVNTARELFGLNGKKQASQ